MKYALIGCGRISTNHVQAAVSNNFEFVAVCDLIPEHMEDVLMKHGLENDTTIRRYTDYKNMIEENDIDLISIATESGLHADIALYCIEHGIHVIIEKPMAMCMQDAEKIINLSKKRGVKVAACHQNRFNIAVQKMREALESNRFGKLSHGSIHVRWNRNKNYYTQAPWRGTWKQDGGALMNQCIHGIDLLRWMLGDEVESVYGVTRQQFHDYLEAEDVGLAVIKFKNGAIATIEDVWEFSQETKEDMKNKGLQEATSNVYGNGHTSLFSDMMEAIRDDRDPYVDAEAGMRALEMVLAIYKSQRTGEVVHLPLKDFSSVDMIGEF